MPWVEVFAVLVVCHFGGDYLLQTEEQALNKYGGLRRGPRERRALLLHVLTYTLVFVPALVWLGGELSAPGLIALALGIFVPHLIIDDGLLVTEWLRRVKHAEAEPGTPLFLYVDQSFHLVCLLAAAVLAGA